MQSFKEYHRPESLEAALALLNRAEARPLAGGTHYQRGLPPVEAAVDLGALGLTRLEQDGGAWVLGAMVTLEDLVTSAGLPAALKEAALRQASRNLRQSATLGGLIATGDSGPLLACLLALDASVTFEPGGANLSGAAGVPLVDFLAAWPAGVKLITGVRFEAGRKLGLAMASRTPADLPILAVAVGQAGDGELCVAAGGVGQPFACWRMDAPLSSAAPLSPAAPAQPAWKDDLRASGEYRRAMLPLLVQRALDKMV